MRRCVRLLIAASLGFLGCDGTIVGGWSNNDDPGDDQTAPDAAPAATTARQIFDRDVLPLVQGNCVGCHSGSDPTIEWMKAAPDAYSEMKVWPHLVELDMPATSRLLVKGMHEGPAWTIDQATSILAWIQAEHDESPPEVIVQTNAVDVVEGANSMPLDAIGSAGSVLNFTAQKLTNGLYLSKISVSSGAAGIHIKHPLFVTWLDTTPTPDPADSFDTIEMDLAASKSATIGGGLVMLENVPATAKLSISFRQISASTGTGTTTLSGCKVVTSFTSNAKPPLSTNCVTCHGGTNSGATSAVDMTKVNDTTTTGQAAACGQVLGRVNLTTPDQSGILLAPDPASGVTHPFKFSTTAYPAFKTSMTTWINAEKAAP